MNLDIGVQYVIEIYAETLATALPIAIGFGIANLIVSIFLNAAFTGRLDLSGRGRYL